MFKVLKSTALYYEDRQVMRDKNPHRASWRGVALLALSLFAAHGAFAQKVTMEFDQSLDFSKYKTFAIREGQLNSKNAALNSELVKKRIDADIVATSRPRDLAKFPGRPI